MPYQHIIDNCLSANIGEGGLSAEALSRGLEAAKPALERLHASYDSGALPLLRQPEREDDIAACRHVAANYRARFSDVVILGTGGSSLGGQTLYHLVDRGFGPPPNSPRLHFMDNVDPDSFEALLEAIEPRRCGVVAISKSGSTAETMCQLLILLPRLIEVVGEDQLPEHVTVITEPTPNPLRRLAERYGLTCIDHDPGVGGRFSVLSVTGVLPALIAGLDVVKLRQGAGQVLRSALDAATPEAVAPAVGAAIAVGLLRERQITQTVLMPYVDRLGSFGLWYRQLWAESLGKDGSGTTPIRAQGAVDQHSQLQLYLAGPRDKMFTTIQLKVANQYDNVDPALVDDEALAYLRGRGLGDLLDAMARATAETLARNGRPVRVIGLEALDETVMGALFMHFMLETIIAAALLGVDPFDQPAVEEGKVLARQYLSEMKS